ncbi:hypothetical protein JKF63_00050 [Porcisia hertigi]|uniref:Uncharacterized protein n=1 Tax=Porcisia hertigi TaxID=2761500 RepID=A0A836HYC7_9TRYP|nr:hypothetical protein JKF63_00050 [Porcisia hertigi]
MTVTIKLANGNQHAVEVSDFSITIADLKKQIEETLEIPADEQRIILRGKVLKDESVLSSVGMEDGNVIHVVRSKKSVAAVSAGNASSTSAASHPAPSLSALPSGPTPTQSAPQQAPANPYAALMSNFGAPQQHPRAPGAGENPFANIGMALGMGGESGQAANASPQQMMDMMQNPMMQQMMQSVLNNPQFTQYLIQSSPQLAALSPDQQQSAIELMRNPFMMQQLTSMMGGLGGTGGIPASNSPSASTPFLGSGFNPAMFAPPVPEGDPRVLYREQLQQLRDMGFPNEEANLAALQQAQGNVQFALERLLGA